MTRELFDQIRLVRISSTACLPAYTLTTSTRGLVRTHQSSTPSLEFCYAYYVGAVVPSIMNAGFHISVYTGARSKRELFLHLFPAPHLPFAMLAFIFHCEGFISPLPSSTVRLASTANEYRFFRTLKNRGDGYMVQAAQIRETVL